MMAKNKSRQKRYDKIDTSGFGLQGDGTWVKISPETKVAHYHLSVDAGRLLIDSNKNIEPIDKENMDLDKLVKNVSIREQSNESFINVYKEHLPKIILDWNWATDIEKTISEITGNKIVLSEYLLNDTTLPVNNEFMVKNFSDFRIYLGRYPEQYETYEASYDGFKTVTINEKLRHDYVANHDYLILGYPSPRSKKTYQLLDDNEIIWLGSKMNAIYLEKVININNKLEGKKKD